MALQDLAAENVRGPLFFNRELSWLDFNDRVLHEAFDDRNPLLERLRFLGIVSSNLDEFYMVRVAGLKGVVTAGITTLSDDGLTPAQQIARVEEATEARIADQQIIWSSLCDELREAGMTEEQERTMMVDNAVSWLAGA